MNVLVGASSGGHSSELLALPRHADNWPYQSAVFVTTLQVVYPRCAASGKTYVIGERHRSSPISVAKVLWQSLMVRWAERPDVPITTGAMPLAILSLVVKLFGGKVVWIDSIAQVSAMTLSGRYVKRFADLCLVQRDSFAENDEKLEFVGALL